MVPDVTGHHVRESPNRDRVSAGRPESEPAAVIDPPQRDEVHVANATELVDEIRQAAVVEAGTGDVFVLIEARQRIGLAPAEAEGAESEDPFGVIHMAKDLADAPFA